MGTEQDFSISNAAVSEFPDYVEHEGNDCAGHRITHLSGRWSPDPDHEYESDRMVQCDSRPPVGYTGGKWKPGHGPVDMYAGYRIVDSSAEERTAAAAATSCSPVTVAVMAAMAVAGEQSVDPVTERIHRIRLSLRSGIFDRECLLLQQRKCLQEFPFVCRVCPFFSTQMSSFTWHLNSSQHNEQTASGLMEMRCQVCFFSCQRIEDLIQHFNLERKKGKTCTRQSAKSLIENQYTRGTIFSCVRRAVSFPCSLCDRRFRLRLGLRIHFLKEHSAKAAPKSKTRSRQQQVRKSVPQETSAAMPEEQALVCPMCSSRHSTKGNLRQHMARHAPPESRPFRCASCVRTFAVRADLTKHVAVHANSKSFECDQCSHAAKSLPTLRKHQKVHRSDKPFKCALCVFSCKLSSNLRRHQRVHSGDKPYSCPYCEYRTGNQENLRKHVLSSQKHRGLPVYCCDACSFGCNDFPSLTNHMQQQHQRSNIRSIFGAGDAS